MKVSNSRFRVTDRKEIDAVVERIIKPVAREKGVADNGYGLSIVVETPAAAVTAAQIAPDLEYFTFGTNDLTQLTHGLHRDRAKFLDGYVLEDNPFLRLGDFVISGELVSIRIGESQFIDHADDQAEAVTAFTLQPRLMVKWRAKPCAGYANYLFLR